MSHLNSQRSQIKLRHHQERGHARRRNGLREATREGQKQLEKPFQATKGRQRGEGRG